MLQDNIEWLAYSVNFLRVDDVFFLARVRSTYMLLYRISIERWLRLAQKPQMVNKRQKNRSFSWARAIFETLDSLLLLQYRSIVQA